MCRNSACISGNYTYIVRRSADEVRVLPRAFSMPSLLPPTTVHPRCVMCGGVFRRGVGEARPKLTCTGGCKEHMWKVLAAPSPQAARRLLCQRYTNPPHEHVANLLAYRAALAARRKARQAAERVARRLRTRQFGRDR